MWEKSLGAAYDALHIGAVGASFADEDVAIAFYNANRNMGNFPSEDVVSFFGDALNFIAEARRSRFLRFFATIAERLDEKNVEVLAEKTFATLPEPENGSEEGVNAEGAGISSTNEKSAQTPASESTESGMEVETDEECDTTSEDSPSEPRSPSSAEAFITSSDDMSTDSDFSEEVGGMLFDHHVWRCEQCYTMLVDWKCPNGHELRRCETCGWQLDNNGPCQRCLGTRTSGARGRGSLFDEQNYDHCGGIEESENEDEIYFDDTEKIWRCTSCHWEIEADNETDGNCHCLNDKQELHFINLTDCLEYSPVDSCSSDDDESTDSEEPNSDDEEFIDDTEIPLDGIASNAAVDAAHLAMWYSTWRNFRPMVGAADVKEDKENVEPSAVSDEVIDVDGQTAKEPSNMPNHIIDRESMDI